MSIEQVEERGRLGFIGGRERMYYNAGVYIGPSLVGALQAGALGFIVGLTFGDRESAFVIAAASAMAGLVLTILARRSHRGVVELEMDGDGISEFENGALRTKIRWRDARARVKHLRVRRVSAKNDYWWVTIGSPNGDVIEVTNADDGLLWPRLPIRDVAHAGVDKLAEMAAQLPPLDRRAPIPQRRAYTGPPWIRVLNIVATIAIVVILRNVYEPVFARQYYSRDDLWSAAVVLGVLGAVRLLPQIVALRALRTRAATTSATAYRSAESAPPTSDPKFIALERRRILLRLAARAALMLVVAACPLVLYFG